MANLKAIGAGDLRDRVVVLRKAVVEDPQGGRQVTWVDLITGTSDFRRLPAKVEIVSGSERLAANSVASMVAYTVIMRYRPDITPTMRLRWQPYRSTVTKTLEIHAVLGDPSNREFLVLPCGEVA